VSFYQIFSNISANDFMHPLNLWVFRWGVADVAGLLQRDVMLLGVQNITVIGQEERAPSRRVLLDENIEKGANVSYTVTAVVQKIVVDNDATKALMILKAI
jgi:hypothetical protein